MEFQKGNKLAGSRKGVKNKINNDVRQYFHKAFANLEGFDENGKLIDTGDLAFLKWVEREPGRVLQALCQDASKDSRTS